MRRIVALAWVTGLLLGGAASIAGAEPRLSAQHSEHKKKPKHEQHGTEQGSTPAESTEPQGLPLRWLFISLGISIVIGAAGGEILASLSPPRDDEKDQTPGRPAPT